MLSPLCESQTRRHDHEERSPVGSLRAKDSIPHPLAVLGHELRVPLAAILGGVSSLEQIAGLPEEARPVCALVRRNVATAQRLIEDILFDARASRGRLRLQRQNVDVHALLREIPVMLKDQIRGRHLELRFDLSAAQATVRADPVRLGQVFWNLFQNAIKFTPPGGWIDVRSWNRGGRIVVEVRDSGVGLRSGEISRLWRPFVQGAREAGKGEGLGLGLYLCRTLVERHGGRIAAASDGEGQGSRFTVELPGARRGGHRARPSAVEKTRKAGATARTRSARILLVDDHADTVEALSMLLRQRGYQVHTADTIAAALDMVDQEGGLDVVISDLALPDGSGLDLMRRLRRMDPRKSPPSGIAVSGFGSPRDVLAARRAGFKKHLTKPVAAAALVGAIEELTGARAPGRLSKR
jgi:CheY-like chemotaxis protein/nitrogen-specific signal transduction histidine kinase